MLSMGDELRRTQGGNNNAYCQDNETSWVDWELGPEAKELTDLVTRLLQLRREHPVFRQKAFFSGHALGEDGVKDLAWFGADGRELTDDEWFDPAQQTIGMYVDGRGIRTRGPHGRAGHRRQLPAGAARGSGGHRPGAARPAVGRRRTSCCSTPPRRVTACRRRSVRLYRAIR